MSRRSSLESGLRDDLVSDVRADRAPNNWWYSYDAGLVHYVAVSTEIYFHPERLAHGAERQYAWLRADLEAANANREAVPWIIVFGHRYAHSPLAVGIALRGSECDRWLRWSYRPFPPAQGVTVGSGRRVRAV